MGGLRSKIAAGGGSARSVKNTNRLCASLAAALRFITVKSRSGEPSGSGTSELVRIFAERRAWSARTCSNTCFATVGLCRWRAKYHVTALARLVSATPKRHALSAFITLRDTGGRSRLSANRSITLLRLTLYVCCNAMPAVTSWHSSQYSRI